MRIASAVVLAPLVLGVAYVGGWPFLLLCGLGAGGILWEWTRLVAGRSDPRILAPGWLGLLVALILAGGAAAGLAAGAVAVSAAASGILAMIGLDGQTTRDRGLWAAGGVVYAGVAALAPALLRRDADFGLQAFLLVAATVWVTDICAYAVGRLVGGPLLWPRISPNKTWAGAIGGLAGGIAGGALVAYAGGLGRLAMIGAVAAALSVSAQAGDLLESAVKRHFGVKDTGRLIPGHGGLMDRLDGFLVAALVALMIGIVRHGAGAPGHGLLVW